MKPSSRISPYVRMVTAALLLMLSLGALTSCKPKYATGYYDGLNEVGPEIKDESCILIPPEPLEKPFDRMLLKDYIIENAPGLKRFAIEDVLGY